MFEYCFHVPALLVIIAAGLFSLQTDDREHDFIVKRGVSFYILVIFCSIN